MKIAQSITELIGNTPLVQLQKIRSMHNVRIVGKLESMNPLSSVKDRIALSMIEAAEKDGTLNKNTRIVEPTSGNTGIALAFICAAKGYSLTLTMPDTMSIERRQLLSRLGAKLVLTPGIEGMGGAVRRAQEIESNTADTIMLMQFENPANPSIHEETTAQEIWDDTDGQVDIIVSGVGTGGTITGIAKALKKKKKGLKVVAVEPEGSPMLSKGIAGPHKIQGIGAGFIPKILERDLIDEIITIGDEEAEQMSKRLAMEEGLLVGISAGANVAASLKIAERKENDGKLIVTILCDTGERYLSTWI